MNTVAYRIEPSQVNSIVLGAAEKAARSHKLRISAPANDYLLKMSAQGLNSANEKGLLEQRREEVERNTSLFIDFMVTECFKTEEIGPEISYEHLVQGLSAFCRRYKHFFPFCTD